MYTGDSQVIIPSSLSPTLFLPFPDLPSCLHIFGIATVKEDHEARQVPLQVTSLPNRNVGLYWRAGATKRDDNGEMQTEEHLQLSPNYQLFLKCAFEDDSLKLRRVHMG